MSTQKCEKYKISYFKRILLMYALRAYNSKSILEKVYQELKIFDNFLNFQ